MALLDKVFIKKPRYSNFDLSRKLRTTVASGLLYPVYIKPLIPGDKVKLGITSLIKTYPLLAPLMGTFKVQFDVFFSHDKNYVEEWDRNERDFDQNDVKLPYFEDEVYLNPLTERFVAYSSACKGNSLACYLGIPDGYLNCSDSKRKFNGFGYLTYIDIVRSYYINPQEPLCYYSGVGTSAQPTYETVKVDEIDGLLKSVYRDRTLSIERFDWASYKDIAIHSQGGFFLRTYRPDMNSAWLSQAVYTSMSKSKVNIENNSFTINQLRTANKFTKMLERTAVSGGRFSDFVRSQFGVSTNQDLHIPEFLGSSSTYMQFDDVMQLGPGLEDPVGTLRGRGYGLLDGSNHYFTASNYGTLMVMMSIVPIVDYYQGVDPYLLKLTMNSRFVPALDCLGFQPKMACELSALPLAGKGSTADKVQYVHQGGTAGVDPFKTAVGYQPAWTEYMSDVNQIKGDFSRSLRYWTLSRSFNFTNPSNFLDVYNYSSYVFPDLYNYCFSDSSRYSENFLVQIGFDVKVKRSISKQVMPTL